MHRCLTNLSIGKIVVLQHLKGRRGEDSRQQLAERHTQAEAHEPQRAPQRVLIVLWKVNASKGARGTEIDNCPNLVRKAKYHQPEVKI
jgi:hypothetical protein